MSGERVSQTGNTPGNATLQHVDPTPYPLHLISTITRT